MSSASARSDHPFPPFAIWLGLAWVALSGPVGAGAKTWTVDDDRLQYPAASFTNIQAAVNAASNGDTIQVYPGFYYENTVVNKTLKLTGAQRGKDARTRATTLAQESVISAGDNPFTLAANNIVLDGFYVRVDLHGDDEGVGVRSLTAFSGDRIINNIMHAGVTTALVPGNRGPTPMLISKNLFLGRLGVAMDSELGAGAHQVVIQDNLFSGASLFFGDNSFSELLITKNKWVQGGGIELRRVTHESVAPGFSIVISENKIFDSQGISLQLRNVTDVLAQNNTMRGGGASGIAVNEDNDNVRIADNKISLYAVAGVKIGSLRQPFTPLADGVEVVGNEIVDNANGLLVDYAENNAIHHNKLDDNERVGIGLAFDAVGQAISDNEIRGNAGGDALDASTGSGTAGTANTWLNNQGSQSSPPGLCSDHP